MANGNYLYTGPPGQQSQTWSQARQPPASAGVPTLIDPYDSAKQAIKAIKGLDNPALGVDRSTIDALTTVGYVLGTVGAAAGAYHGYKRNDSIGWAIAWALLGSMFPVVTIPLSFAQGFGKRIR